MQQAGGNPGAGVLHYSLCWRLLQHGVAEASSRAVWAGSTGRHEQHAFLPGRIHTCAGHNRDGTSGSQRTAASRLASTALTADCTQSLATARLPASSSMT